MTSEAQLLDELSLVRKGMGVRHPSVRDRLGPELRRLCGVDESTPHPDARVRVIGVLRRAVGALPADLALAAQVMFGLEATYPELTLTARQRRLAEAWNVDPMTVRRRCDLALRLAGTHLAEHAEDLAVADHAGELEATEWYTATTITTLRLDTPTPEATEVRTVISLVEGLDRVALRFGLPRPRSEQRTKMGLDVEMQFGGEIEAHDQPSAEYFVHYIRFPRALPMGGSHTFSRVIRVPAGQLMAPHFVSRPLHRVDRFELRVKFHPDRLPRAVWRHNAIPYYVSEADGPGRDLLRPDRLGEVAVVFERLRPSLGYGVGWLI
ncbi:MAG TPA: hypothetical protein VGD67_10730 [Pseudonocardiaceae bacterium]